MRRSRQEKSWELSEEVGARRLSVVGNEAGGQTNDLAGDARILPVGDTVNMGDYEFVPLPPPVGMAILLR